MKDLDFAHIAKKLKNTRIAKNLTQEYVYIYCVNYLNFQFYLNC